MAFSDPQSVTVDTVAISLPRTGSSDSSGQFRSSDQKYRLVVAHNRTRRIQHVARLEFSDIVANPLVPTTNSAVSMAATFTVNVPVNGLSSDQVVDLANALVVWATPANVAKLVGGEI